MGNSVSDNVQAYTVRRKGRRIFRGFVRFLSCIVAFVTTYALILPAITMEKETFCGVAEHIHDESCYIVCVENRSLICDTNSLQIHVHEESCYAEEVLICTLADYVVHSHDELCYVDGKLVCTLPQRTAHVHREGCYEIPEPIPHEHSENCEEIIKGTLICTEEEREGHTHGEDCYTPGQLLCTKMESHLHGEACYTTESVLNCTLTTEVVEIQQEHMHGDSCYSTERSLECTLSTDAVEGEEAHQHGDTCYSERRTLECTLSTEVVEIVEEHLHGDSCYNSETKLVCPEEENHLHETACYHLELTCLIPEEPGHGHEDSCYEWSSQYICGLEAGQPVEQEPILVCTEPVAAVHVHGENCFETTVVAAEPICDSDHEHGYVCYECACQIEEHKHDLPCYSDPTADVEREAYWESTMKDVLLTGDWHADVIAIAESQLGYQESTRNYEVNEDNTIRGYTRYGDWYGIPYGDWCAMFTSFCLRYAGVDVIPIHCGVRPWIEVLSAPDIDLYRTAETYTPIPGDLVFFDWNEDDLSDHVGIVYEIIEATETEPAKLKTIEGNSSNRVQICTYDLDDGQILGYSMLPEKPPQDSPVPEEPSQDQALLEILICGTVSHSHGESCMDEAGELLCQQIEHIHTMDCVDSSSPVGFAQSAATMMYARFALRTEVQTQYHSDLAPVLGSIVISDANGNTVYDSSVEAEDTIDITLGDTYQVQLSFEERSSDQFGTNQLYYQIPSYLKTTDVNNGVIRDEQGLLVAVYTIHNNLLTVTPVGDKNFFEVHNDARFSIGLDAEAVFDAEHGELHIDFNDNYKITINPKENGKLDTHKELVSYDPLTRILTYKCTTAAHGGTIDIVSIADYWYGGEGVADSDVTVPWESVSLTDTEGNDITDQWYIGINERGNLWIVPMSTYSLKHDEFITLNYQVQLSENLTQNFTFENTYDTTGSFNSTTIYDYAQTRDPITFTNVTKNGTYATEYVDGVAVDALTWTVKIVNPDLQEIVITDNLSAGQSFCQHQPVVIKARVPNTNSIEEITVGWDTISTYANNTQFVMTLPQGYTEYELIYHSHYALNENGPGIQAFENTVTTNIKIGDVPTSGTATVGVLKAPPTIDKQITTADEDGLTFTIDCFMPGALYGQTSVHLYDTLASWGALNGYISQESDALKESMTVTITPVGGETYQLQPYEGQESAQNTYLVAYAGQSFTMYFNTGVAQSATSVWLCDTDATLTISYHVPMDSVMLDGWEGNPTDETLYEFLKRTGQNLNNTAQFNYSPNDVIHDSVQYTLPKEKDPPLKKTGAPVKNQNGVYEYSVWFSSGEGEGSIFPVIVDEYGNYLNNVNDLKLTDIFDSELEYVDGSFKVTIWSYWNHDVRIMSFIPKSGAVPTLVTREDGKTEMTAYASDLIVQQDSVMGGFEWLSEKNMLQVLQYLPAGYQYEFTYQLRVKDDVKNTSIEDTLYLDNMAEVEWTEPEGPKSTGPVDFQVAYDTGILQKSMGRFDGDSNLLSFSILVNDKGLDLSPGDTYILHDTMTPNLMLIYTSLEIELLDANGTVTEFRTPEQCGFTYNPDLNRMTFTLPDSQIIRLKYNCRVNGDGGSELDVGNAVVLEGYSEIQDVVNTKFLIRDHIGSADASSKSFVLQKQDAYNFAVLPDVSFELYGDTERTGSKTITVDGRTLWYYATFTTDENGMVNIADSQLSAEHLYALRELEPPPGYEPQSKPYLFYMVYPPKGVTTDIDSIAEGALVVIKNYPITYMLPETGGTGSHFFVAGGLILCLLTIYLFYVKSRREVLNSS